MLLFFNILQNAWVFVYREKKIFENNFKNIFFHLIILLHSQQNKQRYFAKLTAACFDYAFLLSNFSHM